MDVCVQYRDRGSVVGTGAQLGALLDFVENAPEATERFPQLMRCRSRGVRYGPQAARDLAQELLRVGKEVSGDSQDRGAHFEPLLRNLTPIVLRCARKHESMVIDVVDPTQGAEAARAAGTDATESQGPDGERR